MEGTVDEYGLSTIGFELLPEVYRNQAQIHLDRVRQRLTEATTKAQGIAARGQRKELTGRGVQGELATLATTVAEKVRREGALVPAMAARRRQLTERRDLLLKCGYSSAEQQDARISTRELYIVRALSALRPETAEGRVAFESKLKTAVEKNDFETIRALKHAPKIHDFPEDPLNAAVEAYARKTEPATFDELDAIDSMEWHVRVNQGNALRWLERQAHLPEGSLCGDPVLKVEPS